MARDAKWDDARGNWEIWLHCPECNFSGLVYYTTKPPAYCSDACKQRAYRKRKIRSTSTYRGLEHDWSEAGLRNQLPLLERICDRYGLDAAKDATALALSVAGEFRRQHRNT